MAHEDDLMEQYYGFENTEENFEADQEEKIRKAGGLNGYQKDKQTVFTPESIKSPLLKNVIKGLDEFDTYEAKQEAGKFGKRSKGNQDDRP